MAIKLLEDSGELDNTIIVMTGDNGIPFPRCKSNIYDMGVHVPLAIRWGDEVEGNREVKDFVSLSDLAPTFLEAAKCDVPDEVDGRSLMPILNGTGSFDEDHVITEAFGHQLPFWQRMVRTHHTKYIYNPTGNDEFYNLDDDPHETKNIIDIVPSNTVARHREILMEWMKAKNDRLTFLANPML